MGILAACMPVDYVHAVPAEARRGRLIFCDQSFRQFCATIRVLGTEPWVLQKGSQSSSLLNQLPSPFTL